MELEDGFKRLQEEYIQSLPGKLQAIKDWILVLEKKPSEGALKELRHLVHQLAGSAGLFGFPSISILCKSWDQKLSHLLANFSQQDLSLVVKELPTFIQELENLL